MFVVLATLPVLAENKSDVTQSMILISSILFVLAVETLFNNCALCYDGGYG